MDRPDDIAVIIADLEFVVDGSEGDIWYPLYKRVEKTNGDVDFEFTGEIYRKSYVDTDIEGVIQVGTAEDSLLAEIICKSVNSISALLAYIIQLENQPKK